MKKLVYIIGGGFSGLTAKLYLSLANIESKILDNDKTKPPLYNIKNFPGHINLTSIELLDKIKEQIYNIDSKPYIKEYAYEITTLKDNEILIKTDISELLCTYAIVCTGFSYNNLGIQLDKNNRKFVFNCVENIELFVDKDILIIGAGDRCSIYLDKLNNIVKSITVLVRSNAIKATNTQNFYNSKINVLFKSFLKGFDENIATIFDSKNSKEITIKVDYIIVATGVTPSFPKSQLKTDEQGTIITNCRQETSIKNLFSAGIVANRNYQQALNACHFGSVAATEIIKRIKENNNNLNYY